jgi:thiamine-phosphate pyrophosphorylase
VRRTTKDVLLYYITDRKQFPGTPAEQRRALLAKIAEAAHAGVDYVQLREKDLSIRELEQLAREAVAAVGQPKTDDQRPRTRLLINSRTDVALAAGADGVHLPVGDHPPSEVRAIWAAATRSSKLETRNFSIGVSCHSVEEVASADSHGADFAVFGPVFEKSGAPGYGQAALRAACSRGAKTVPHTEAGYATTMPVLALGGVTLGNAAECVRAGAAGIAGIRLFQQNDVATIVRTLRP